MSNRLRIALLVNRDPTAKGVILTELRFFNTIFEGKNYDVYLVATSDHYMKIAKGIQQHFTFPTKCILIENFENRGLCGTVPYHSLYSAFLFPFLNRDGISIGGGKDSLIP